MNKEERLQSENTTKGTRQSEPTIDSRSRKIKRNDFDFIFDLLIVKLVWMKFKGFYFLKGYKIIIWGSSLTFEVIYREE